MNKTPQPYNIAIEQEIEKWKGFAKALRKEDHETFKQLIEMFKNNTQASQAANNPFTFEPMTMTILLAQQQKIKHLEKKLQTLKPKTPPSTNPPPTKTLSNQTQKTLQIRSTTK